MNPPVDLAEFFVIPLAEVARRTPWTERSLLDDCRAGVIDHVNRKGSYGLTPAQLDALIKQHTKQGTGEPVSVAQREADELAEARAYNARSNSRAGQRAA